MEPNQGFEDFVHTRMPALYRFGYALTGSPHDAADLVQEALIRLGTSWSRVRRKDNVEAYVRTTMVRLHISAWRRRRRERLVDSVPERGYADPGLLRVDGQGDLWQALRELPPRQQAVLVLRYYEHKTDDEIAAMLGVSRGTVSSQAFRALERLRAGHRPANRRPTAQGDPTAQGRPTGAAPQPSPGGLREQLT